MGKVSALVSMVSSKGSEREQYMHTVHCNLEPAAKPMLTQTMAVT